MRLMLKTVACESSPTRQDRQLGPEQKSAGQTASTIQGSNTKRNTKCRVLKCSWAEHNPFLCLNNLSGLCQHGSCCDAGQDAMNDQVFI